MLDHEADLVKMGLLNFSEFEHLNSNKSYVHLTYH